MLERSKAADLILVSRDKSCKSLARSTHVSFLKNILKKHVSRVRGLEIINLHHQFDPSALPVLFEDLQPLRLHSLRLNSCARWGFYSAFPTGVVETDSLLRLEIIGCDGPWYSMSRALTTLKLHNMCDRLPLIKFLELLRGLGRLQVLDMEDSLPFATGSDRSSLIDPICLPSLQYLSLASTANQEDVSNILSRIIVPPTATLKFAMRIREKLDDLQVEELASSYSAFFSRMGHSHAYRSLYVWCEKYFRATLRAWNDDGTVSIHDGWVSYVPPDLEIIITSFEGVDRFDPRRVVVREIFPSIPLFDITTLTLNVDPLSVLQHTFGRLLRIAVSQCTGAVIEALTWKCKSYDDNQLSDYCSVVFPALNSLSILSGTFGSGMAERFQDCLMERYERNAELLKLELVDCRELYHSDVEKFREIVGDVEWDNIQQVVICNSIYD